MGVPVVRPSNTPDKISTESSSLRGVVNLDCPGFLRFKNFWISSSQRESPAGHPSTTTPTPFPWDSPQVVILNIFPNVDPAIGMYSFITKYKMIIKDFALRDNKNMVKYKKL